MHTTTKAPNNQNFTELTKTKRATRLLTLLVILLAALTAAIPGILALMQRADAQVALGNAKSLRMALQTAATEAYAAGRPFLDRTANGGVTEEVWRSVITDSRVPGDFWVLQADEAGYEVLRFTYQEGDFTVEYSREPLAYEVYYRRQYVQTQSNAVY